jgi:hypothetical protein
MLPFVPLPEELLEERLELVVFLTWISSGAISSKYRGRQFREEQYDGVPEAG